MEAITLRLRPLNKVLSKLKLVPSIVSLLEAAAVFALAQHHGWWPVAILVVAVVELRSLRVKSLPDFGSVRRLLVERTPALLIGMSTALIIAVAPRLVTQVLVAVLYAVWRLWWAASDEDASGSLGGLLIMIAVTSEALFLMAAVWRTSEWVILGLVWCVGYAGVYSVLSRRKDRTAGIMAATWALICAEVSWVLLLWLFTYTVSGGYLLVPQPVLILTALAYCFGSIYVSQRKGALSRGRLTEYLLIGLILIAIVITGTPWRGSL